MPLKEQQTIDIFQRLTKLESELGDTKDELKDVKFELNLLEQKMTYYDKVALKWGGAIMGILMFGAFVGGHLDKLKGKLIEWFLQ